MALLIIDEVGFEPMNRQEASLFFRLRVVLCSPVPPNTYQASPGQVRQIFSVQSSAESQSLVDQGATGEVNPDRVLFSAVFVSSAGATSVRTLHPTPIEAQPSQSEGRASETFAAEKLIRALIPASSWRATSPKRVR